MKKVKELIEKKKAILAYLKECKTRQLFVCYYDKNPDSQKYRVEFLTSGLETKAYTLNQFYKKFWKKGLVGRISIESVPDDIPLLENLFDAMGI